MNRLTELRVFIDIKLHLSAHRYQHTLGVSSTAKKLADTFGCDAASASLAALLHDNAKSLSAQELLKLCGESVAQYGLSEEYEPVLHAFAGAERARERFGITDEDILNAVRFHTTGRAHMSQLEKIIFIADYTEDGRKSFEGLEEARRLSYIDLDMCCFEILKQTIHYLVEQNKAIHPLTFEAYEDFRTICSQKDDLI